MISHDVHLVVATFNIRRCIGLDGRHDLERIAEIIRSLDSDLVALQEVDTWIRAADRTDQLRYLAEATGLEAVAGPAQKRTYGFYGNGLLSRLPVIAVRRHDLSVARFEPRAALEVDVDAPFGTVRLVTTHLGLRRRERRAQLDKLLELLSRGGTDLQVLAGDLNDPSRRSSLSRSLRRLFGAGAAPRTFPARRPILPLDRVLVRPASTLVEIEAVRTPLTRVASDHLPLRAVLRPPAVVGGSPQ